MVSIVITAYNVEDTIRKAIDSALAQSYPHIEVVVVDDCSTDHTAEIIASYGERIKVVKHEENLGAGMARRDGLKFSTGDFAVTLDADDWMDEDLIARLVARQRETGAEIVSGGVTIERLDGSWDAHCYGDKYIDVKKDVIEAFLAEKVRFMNNKLIARRLLNEVEYCERRFIEDTPTIYPMLFLANGFAYAATTGYHYLHHDKSLTKTASTFKWALYGCIAEMDIVNFFEKHDYHEFDEQLAKSIIGHTDIIYDLHPSIEEVREHQDAWNYFTTELIRRADA